MEGVVRATPYRISAEVNEPILPINGHMVLLVVFILILKQLTPRRLYIDVTFGVPEVTRVVVCGCNRKRLPSLGIQLIDIRDER